VTSHSERRLVRFHGERRLDLAFDLGDALVAHQIGLRDGDDGREVGGEQDTQVLASRLRRPVVGRDGEQPVVELLADETANGGPSQGSWPTVSTKLTRSASSLTTLGAVGLPVGVVHPDRTVIVEAVDAVGEVRGEAAFDLVGLDVEEGAGPALAVVGGAGDERADQRALPVVDVAGGADDDVVVVLEDGALPDRGDADDAAVGVCSSRVIGHGVVGVAHVVDPQVWTSSMWAPASSAISERTSIDSENSAGGMPARPPASVTPTTYVAPPSPERTRCRSCAARLSRRPSARWSFR